MLYVNTYVTHPRQYAKCKKGIKTFWILNLCGKPSPINPIDTGSCVSKANTMFVTTTPGGEEEIEKVTVRVQSEGRWLKLIRPSLRPNHANVTICLQGTSVVWCEISADIDEDRELLAAYRREPAHTETNTTDSARSNSTSVCQEESCSPSRSVPSGVQEEEEERLHHSPNHSPPEGSAGESCTPTAPATSAVPTSGVARSPPPPPSPAGVSVKCEEEGSAAVSPSAMVVKSVVLRACTPSLPVGSNREGVSTGSGGGGDGRSPNMLDRKSSSRSPEHGSSPQAARYPLIYGCVQCGVKFSNPGTLAAHMEFYCAKKNMAVDATAQPNSGEAMMEVDRTSHKSSDDLSSYKQRADAMLTHMKREQLSPASSSRRSDGDRSTNSTPKEKHRARRLSVSSGDELSCPADGPPAGKVAKMGHTYQCPFCSYSSDKKISLNRHLRMHNNSGSEDGSSRPQTASPEGGGGVEDANSSDNFCRECNIQFSSRKTYMGHKEFYCATRRRSGDEGNAGPEARSAQHPAAAPGATQVEVELQQQMASYLPTQAAAYAVQSFLRSPGASQTMNNILHGQHPAIVVAAPMVAPGAMGSINTPTVILQPVIAMPPNMMPAHPSAASAAAVAAAAAAATARHGAQVVQPNLPSPGTPVAQPVASGGSRSTTPGAHESSRSERSSEAPLDLSCKKESPSPPRSLSVDGDHDRRPRTPVCRDASSSDVPTKDAVVIEPQDLSVRREWKTPNSDTSSNGRSPHQHAGSTTPPARHIHHPPGGQRSPPEHPTDGVTPTSTPAVPPTAEMLAAQAQVINMISQQAAAAAMMLHAQPPNISKCLECNIVFYKHENFLIHKEHYCAGRRISKRERMLAKEMSPAHHSVELQHSAAARISSNGSLTPTSENNRSPGHSSGSPHQSTPPTLTPTPVAPHGGQPPGAASKADLQGFLQFYCIPCKIKFSSVDTLNAHQEFYCPFNKENHMAESSSAHHQHHRPLRTNNVSPSASPAADSDSRHHHHHNDSRPDSGSGSDAQERGGSPEGDVYACTHCGHTYPSYRLLKLHICKAASAHLPLLRCPYCELITQSENRLVEHIKGHAPTKAYRCTICGYRGNTVRGMRMHGKTHVDEGQPFSDENMVEYEEPPIIPRRHRTAAASLDGGGPVNIEAELIRIKNEPYKRRRSRKGYEKAENMSPSARRLGPHVCVTCNEAFSDTARLRQHMRVHLQEATYACRSCDLVTNDKASLVRHVKRVHETAGSTRTAPMDVDVDSTDNISEIADAFTRNTDSIDSNVSMKRESMEEDMLVHRHLNRETSPRPPPPRDTIDHPTSPGSVPHAEMMRSQSHSPSVSRRRSQSPENRDFRSTSEIVIKSEKLEGDVNQNRCPQSSSRRSPSEQQNGDVARTPPPPTIISSAEHNNPPANSENFTASKAATPPPAAIPKREFPPSSVCTSSPPPPPPMPVLPREMAPPVRRPNTPLSPVNGTRAEPPSPTELLLAKKGDKSGVNYCKQCDITFVYMSSFMAHKQYYCSSHANERQSESRAPQTEVS